MPAGSGRPVVAVMPLREPRAWAAAGGATKSAIGLSVSHPPARARFLLLKCDVGVRCVTMIGLHFCD